MRIEQKLTGWLEPCFGGRVHAEGAESGANALQNQWQTVQELSLRGARATKQSQIWQKPRIASLTPFTRNDKNRIVGRSEKARMRRKINGRHKAPPIIWLSKSRKVSYGGRDRGRTCYLHNVNVAL